MAGTDAGVQSKLSRRRGNAFSVAVVAALVGMSAAACGRNPAQGLSSRAIARINGLAKSSLASDGVGGMTIGVVTESGLLWTKSYGYADMARHTAASRETVYRIGSITKQFTAIMLRQLAYRGVVRLSDPVDQYFAPFDSIPSRDGRARRVTLFQLATMTAGLAQEPDDEGRYEQGDLDRWEDVLVTALRHTKFDAEPGTAWEYSNIGYAALGAALQHACRRPYVDYVREEILVPLGMTQTDFVLTPGMRGRLATGYVIKGKVVDTSQPLRELSGRGYKVPNGGLFSTVDDLAAFVRFEMGYGPDSVLPRAEVAHHFAALAYATNDLKSGYGVGFHAVRRGSMVALAHPGSVAGYLAAVYFDAATHTGAIVLRNVDDERFDVLDLCLRVLEIAAGARK